MVIERECFLGKLGWDFDVKHQDSTIVEWTIEGVVVTRVLNLFLTVKTALIITVKVLSNGQLT